MLTIAKFIIYLIIYIQIPGLIIISLSKQEIKGLAKIYLVGFFAGIGLLLLEFFALSYLNTLSIITLISPVMISLFIIVHREKFRGGTIKAYCQNMIMHCIC